MQNELEELLIAQFGASNVRREVEHVDLAVADSRRNTEHLIEVKSELVPKLAIRNAIGQLLEYAYFDGSKRKRKRIRLSIVAPNAADAPSVKYLDHLRERFALDIHYRRYVRGSMLFTL